MINNKNLLIQIIIIFLTKSQTKQISIRNKMEKNKIKHNNILTIKELKQNQI